MGTGVVGVVDAQLRFHWVKDEAKGNYGQNGGYFEEFAIKGDRNGQKEGKVRVGDVFLLLL